MTTQNETLQSRNKVDMSALWQEAIQDDGFEFEIKAQTIATDLVRAMSARGFTQSQLAEKLDWKPSRISKVLHGNQNLTIQTLQSFAKALDFEFDVIYRMRDQHRAPQAWEDHRVMMDHILSIYRNADTLCDKAEKNLNQSKAILSSASELSKRVWNSASKAHSTIKVLKVA